MPDLLIRLSSFYYENEIIINSIGGLIGLVSAIIVPVWVIIKFVYKQTRPIDAYFKTDSTIYNKLNSFVKIILTNHKDSDISINGVDVVFYDKFNKYILTLSHEVFILNAHSTKTLDIKPVSSLSVNNKFVDISYLALSKRQFCFVLRPKNYVISLKRFIFLWLRKKNLLIPFRCSYKGIIHSPNWEYGFTYMKNNISSVGFFNHDKIYSKDYCLDKSGDYCFTPDFVLAILEANGFENIKIEKLTTYQNVIPEMLGVPKNLDKHEKVITLTDKEILSMEIKE